MNKSTKQQIDELFNLEAGQIINNPDKAILISSKARFTRKSLKHFIESRKKFGNSRADIDYLIEKAPDVIENPQINMDNPNQTYPRSSLLGKFYVDSNKAVMVILDAGGEIRDIISLHFKKKSHFYELLNKYRVN